MFRTYSFAFQFYGVYIYIYIYIYIFVQQEPTGCTIYFQFILLTNFYIFRSGLLIVIRRYYSVYTAIDICHAENNGIVKIT
jgi:hypothetical protein